VKQREKGEGAESRGEGDEDERAGEPGSAGHLGTPLVAGLSWLFASSFSPWHDKKRECSGDETIDSPNVAVTQGIIVGAPTKVTVLHPVLPGPDVID